MAQFHFQLEGVLKQRKNIERERQRQHASIQLQMNQLQDELKELDRTVQASSAELRDGKLVGTIDLNYLAAHRRFTASTQRKAMNLLQRMSLVQRQLDESRKLLTEAAVQRKVIEKLRERQFERWKAEIERKETALTDEMGMQIAFRNLMEEVAPEQMPPAREMEFPGGDA